MDWKLTMMRKDWNVTIEEYSNKIAFKEGHFSNSKTRLEMKNEQWWTKNGLKPNKSRDYVFDYFVIRLLPYISWHFTVV